MISEEEFLNGLKEIPHDILCKYTARILYQLTEKGITIGQYMNEPEYIDGLDACGNYFRIDGRKIPREEQAKLCFSEYDKKLLSRYGINKGGV